MGVNARRPAPTTTGARTWLAETPGGRRFAFSATTEADARRRAAHEAGTAVTVRPYLEVPR